MFLCDHAKARTDGAGALEYYCEKLAWRMGLDGLEHCRKCQYHNEKRRAGSE